MATLRRVVARVPGASVTGRGLRVGSRAAPAGVRSVTVLDGGTCSEGLRSVPLDAAAVGESRCVAPGRGRVVAARVRPRDRRTGRGAAAGLEPGRAARVRVGRHRLPRTRDGANSPSRGARARRALAAVGDRRRRARSERDDPARRCSRRSPDRDRHLPARPLDRAHAAAPLEAANAIASGDRRARRGARPGRVRAARRRLQPDGRAARAAARGARDRAHARSRRDHPLRRGARGDARLDAAPAGVVETAVEATGADGGLVLGREGELVRTGDPEARGERIAFPLRAGSLRLRLARDHGGSFEAEQVETAASLAAQAVVALENARLHRIVERQAMVDSLTGLANRRSLEETLRAELARAARFHDSVCVVLADLDDFKQVNDTTVTPWATRCSRRSPARSETVRESDVAGRWGGEEFALVLPGTDAAGGARLAERARMAIEGSSIEMPNGERVSVTASFGVASSRRRGLGEIARRRRFGALRGETRRKEPGRHRRGVNVARDRLNCLGRRNGVGAGGIHGGRHSVDVRTGDSGPP